MDRRGIGKVCLALPGATLDHPFGDHHDAYRVGGKMFVMVGEQGGVSFKVSDAWIGDETTAAIKIKTLLGRKYLALDPSGDEPLDPNTTIPLERTTAPYDVLEAFRGLSRTVDDIDVNQLARSFDVLSRTFANTPEDVRGLLWTAIHDDNPVVFFEHRTLYPLKGEVPEELEPIPLGKARVHREGTDVTVIATGRLVHEALQAAEEAEKDGISVEIVDPRTLLPLDEETIVASVRKTTRCVTAHEAVTRGGFGAELAAIVQHGAFDWLDAPIERVGARFAPLPFAPVMEQWVVPHAADVLDAVRRTVARA